jgi:hypothetical protein
MVYIIHLLYVSLYKTYFIHVSVNFFLSIIFCTFFVAQYSVWSTSQLRHNLKVADTEEIVQIILFYIFCFMV